MSNYSNHEDAMRALTNGKIETSPSEQQVQDRVSRYGQGSGSTNPSYTNNVGGPQTQGGATLPQQHDSYDGGASFSSQAGSTQQGQSSSGQSASYTSGINMPTNEQLQNEFLERYPRAYGVPIVAVKKNGRGNLEAFKLQNGQVLDYSQMMQAAFDRQLQGIEVQNNQQGELILRSSPDGYRNNNLDRLPEFE